MHYVEAFAGALGVLLERPHPCNRPYHSETLNDLDGHVVNVWRSLQWYPEATAAAASWPVTECDKHARQLAVLAWHDERVIDLLAGSATWCDPQMAGWWLYGVCCQIGAFHGRGPWTADPVTGRLVKRGTQEPGVRRNLPHLSDNGQGVHRPQLREPGVGRDLPHLGNDGQGVHHAGLREPGVGDDPEFHPLTMPELVRWFQWLSARLRHCRIVNGDWSRVVTTGARLTLPVRQGDGVCGVFLDPPYSPSERDKTLYMVEASVREAVEAWCLETMHDPRTRMVLAGYDGEYAALEAAGWTVHEWYKDGWLRGGYGNIDGSSQQHRERLWASPTCVVQETRQMSLAFGVDGRAGAR